MRTVYRGQLTEASGKRAKAAHFGGKSHPEAASTRLFLFIVTWLSVKATGLHEVAAI